LYAGRRPIPAVLDDLLLVADDAVLVQEASIIVGMLDDCSKVWR
jgi:threonine dehydratase